jgi:hypothetical protein
MIRLDVSMLQLAALVLVAAVSNLAHGGTTQPPQLVTIPSPPPTDQPFQAQVYLTSNRGFAGFDVPVYMIGNVITAGFDTECPISPCFTGDSGYWPFTVEIPPLGPGDYILNVVVEGSPVPIAQFTLAVGSPATFPAPAYHPLALLLLIGLILLPARSTLHRRLAAPT